MLVVMTFDVGLLISTGLGLGLGNFIFSFFEHSDLPEGLEWKKTGNYEPNPDPCCHKLEISSDHRPAQAKETKIGTVAPLENIPDQ